MDVKTPFGTSNTANIFLSIYDNDGSHEDVVIYSKEYEIATGVSPEVVVVLNVSRPSKLRVRHDEAGESPLWFLDKVSDMLWAFITFKNNLFPVMICK